MQLITFSSRVQGVSLTHPLSQVVLTSSNIAVRQRMKLDTFNKRSRPAIFRKLSEEKFDLLVIGGGITGASVFRDAALRGMKVALVEAKDFASATSGRSSKLIHGGLRYIKNLGLRLAWESCHERNLHIRLNKRLVRPLPFLVPLYRARGERRGAMRLGMLLYEALSGFNNSMDTTL